MAGGASEIYEPSLCKQEDGMPFRKYVFVDLGFYVYLLNAFISIKFIYLDNYRKLFDYQ